MFCTAKAKKINNDAYSICLSSLPGDFDKVLILDFTCDVIHQKG